MSINAAVPEIAIFQPVPKEKSVEKIYWVEQRPTSQISDKGPIEFVIAGTSPDYVCLDKTYLHTKVKITNADGSDLVAPSGIPENVGMVNLSQSSLFRQVDVTLNQQIINIAIIEGLEDNLFNLLIHSFKHIVNSRSDFHHYSFACLYVILINSPYVIGKYLLCSRKHNTIRMAASRA